MNKTVYVVSKVKHVEMWKQLRSLGLNIISSWIDDGNELDIDFARAWPLYLKQASSADFILVYVADGEKLAGGLAEVGAGLAANKRVILVGDSPQFRTMRLHPNVWSVQTIRQALLHIEETAANPSLQREIAEWAGDTFGDPIRWNLAERMCRVLEEAIETAQPILSKDRVQAILDWVYSSTPGEVDKELGGLGVTVMACAEALGIDLLSAIREEVDRIYTIPVDRIRQKHAEKAAAGIAMSPSVRHSGGVEG